MTEREVKVIGEFLRYYQTDLEYIDNFRRFLDGQIPLNDYSSKLRGSFYNFLVEFRIARNIRQGSSEELLHLTKEWCSQESCDDIDGFAQKLKTEDISRGATLSSLASKVLFLNNPWKILPMDALARKTLGQKNNIYSEYKNRVEIFGEEKKQTLDYLIEKIAPFVIGIESSFISSLSRIETIRRNRLTDKMLWVVGQSIE